MSADVLTELLSQYASDDEIYHDLMQFKIREILLVATVYDAFILEQEGKITELIFGEYHQLNLSSAPRVTGVSCGEEALEMIENRRFDMVILTMHIDEMTPFELSDKIRSVNGAIPILLLLNNDSDIELVMDRRDRLKHLDRIFVWNGDAKVFLTMIKYIEDKINAVNDTKTGHVRIILLVEDSIRYYSRYLPILHVEIMKQTQRLIADEHLDDMKKLLRMRTRPKVLMAVNFEEAIEIFDRYKDYLLCVISDVRFCRKGKMDGQAGVRLIRHINSSLESLPVLLQSADPENAAIASKMNVHFLNKNSDILSRDLTEFILNNLGFGDFIFRNTAGEEIDRARSMSEFKNLLTTVPDESLIYHANRNHFSSWLMARGEIQIAKYMQPIKVSDFDSYAGLREHLISICNIVHEQKTRGKLIQFDRSVLEEQGQVVRVSGGSIGGKGRGIAFLNMLLQERKLFSMFPDVNVLIPQTAIIGTDEYDYFMEENHFQDAFGREKDFMKIKTLACGGRLSGTLREKLYTYLEHVKDPISVRSSSLFEDSISQPFSGIYETFFLPNNHPDIKVRLSHLEGAIKLVYASVYDEAARSYFDAIQFKVGEEKMAVLLQKVVGNRFRNRFYPHFSGVAQSYNYYPVSYLEPSDGIAVIGFGLGKYVVDGEKAWRFCPKYPKVDFIAQSDLLDETQVEFYSLDMDDNDVNLLEGSDATLARMNIHDVEDDGTLRYCASVWDYQNECISAGIDQKGPRILNFAPILKYDHFPLAQTIGGLLENIKGAMGMPVEIEFAVDLGAENRGGPYLYLLQIKPLLRDLREFDLDLEGIDRRDLLLYTNKAMGNGTIDDLYDVVYADPELFDRSKTVEMVGELEKLNGVLKTDGRSYVLIGPGRWGSRDRWLGVPVRWAQISNAGIIVEVGLADIHIDSSLGSHFFHNITSKNIGYFDVPYGSDEDFVDWEWLRSLPVVNRTEYFIHVRIDKPLLAKMNGRAGVSVIYK